MELKVEIESPDEFELVLDFIGKADCADEEAESLYWGFVSSTGFTEGQNGVKVKYTGHRLFEAVEAPTIITFIISIPTGVVVGVVANWLYNVLRRHKTKKLVIQRRVTRVEADDIRVAIEEETKTHYL